MVVRPINTRISDSVDTKLFGRQLVGDSHILGDIGIGDCIPIGVYRLFEHPFSDVAVVVAESSLVGKAVVMTCTVLVGDHPVIIVGACPDALNLAERPLDTRIETHCVGRETRLVGSMVDRFVEAEIVVSIKIRCNQSSAIEKVALSFISMIVKWHTPASLDTDLADG